METVNLFGENMSIMLPPDRTDISTLREMPDNQEVFAHSTTDQSIMVDILEYVNEPDEQAVRTHMDEIASSNESKDNEVTNVEVVPLQDIQMRQCQSAYFLSCKQSVSKFNETPTNRVGVHLCLFRLPEHDTDIVLSFNDPLEISIGSSSHGEMPTSTQPWTLDHFRQAINSLQILNDQFLG